MQFEVKVDASPSEVLAYCYNRVIELWPDAVMVDLSGMLRVFCRSITGSSTIGPRVRIYRTKDHKQAEQDFKSEVPYLHIEVEGDTVTVVPKNGADEVSRALAKLPIWVHKATESSRLQVV